MSTEANSIRRAAQRLLKDASDRDAYSVLIGGLYDAIDGGIESALDCYEAAEAARVADGYFSGFLEYRVGSEGFLRGLVDAKNPEAYSRVAALNYARDEIRKSPILQGKEFDEAELADVWEDNSRAHTEPGGTHSPAEGARTLEWLDDLPDDDRLLLGVVYVEFSRLPDSLVELLARRRGVDVSIVTAELGARATEQADRRSEWASELNKRAARIVGVQRRVAQVTAAIAQRDGYRDEETEPLSAEEIERLSSSQKALLDASSQERSAYLEHLEKHLRTLTNKQDETQKKVGRDLPAGPRYEEVLRILGKLPDDEKERKTAINGLNQRFRRIRKRLRKDLAADRGLT